ncbi:MbcA/ParS/Xre antitoxin family protein [Caballeronia sp. LjRoot34]|uniref:MbcA/ParS/Xre antitoxin family protein n=1 Tax=Caballeronia sp. LjRoot34 TaxID=3342325 RepID=UPI003ECE39B2
MGNGASLYATISLFDAIVGSGEKAQAWLTGENLALNARPVDLIRSAQGLVNVVEYLDLYRGRI